MKTLRHLEIDHTEMDKPHGIWQASRMQPFMVAAATTRARALVGQLGLNFQPWKSDPLCPLCEDETECTAHFIAKCRALNHVRTTSIEKILNMYEAEGKTPPRSEEERVSALLNGDRYRSSSNILVKLQTESQNAHNLASITIHKMYVE